MATDLRASGCIKVYADSLRKTMRLLTLITPRPKESQKLSAQERYRIRQGDYRIIYSIQDDQSTVHVYKIGHRWEVYRS